LLTNFRSQSDSSLAEADRHLKPCDESELGQPVVNKPSVVMGFFVNAKNKTPNWLGASSAALRGSILLQSISGSDSRSHIGTGFN
jgi:hypothetical protein